MMNPEKLIEDLFDDKNLPDYKLRGFTEDHLLRLSLPANNPGGIYNTLFADITLSYNAFFGKITGESTKDAISQGLTITMENAKGEALALLSRLEGLVSFKFGKNSAIYQEFYPYGMSEYHDANLPELPTLLQRYVNAASAHLVVSNPAETADVMAKIGSFNTARAAQLATFGEVETLQTGRRQDRKALTLQLTKGLLTIAINNLENPDNFNNYYNPSYLPLSEKSLSISGFIDAGAVIMAVEEGIITQSGTVRVFNTGTTSLVFSLNDLPGVIHPQHQITVPPATDILFGETLPVFEKYYLNIQNLDTANNGKWKVVVG